MIEKKTLHSWAFQSYRGLQLLLLVLILATVFFRVFPLELQKRIVNYAIRFKKLDVLYLYCALYVGAVVLAGLLKYLINVLQGYIGQKILYQMRSELYDHILKLPLSFFRRTPPGMVIASLTSELAVVGDFMGGALAVPVINVLTLITFAAYLAYLEPMLALLSFSIYPIEILIIPVLQRRLNRLNQNRIDVTRSMSNVIGEAVSGIHEIQSNAGFSIENLKLSPLTTRLLQLRHQMNIHKFLIKFINNFFQSFGPVILFLLGGYLTIQGQFDLGALVAFLSAYEKLYDPWKELMDYYQDFQDCRVRYNQVVSYFDAKPEFELLPSDLRDPYRLSGEIEVKDLSLMADDRFRLLDQISMKVSSGEQLAVVGPSGSGKSTLAMALGQLTSYGPGHIFLDGRELKTLTKYDVSHNIAYVAQHPFIFDGTIKDNILYASRALTGTGGKDETALPGREEILQVVHMAGLPEDILQFGLGATLVQGRHDGLALRLIELRQEFIQRWRMELSDVVDFLDVDRFQHHTPLGLNITFGYPNRPEYEADRLPENRIFRDFLENNGLVAPLLSLGMEVSRQTVSLLKDLQQDDYFFEMSPISPEEINHYAELVARSASTDLSRLPGQDETALLRVALRFTPARHKMAAVSPSMEARIIESRRHFMERISVQDPDGFSFYRPSEYLFSLSLMDNIVFGRPKEDYPGGMQEVRHRVVNLLEERGMLHEVLEVGLEFQVGSKGDRLSGGQKQKLALARALLKGSPILILDEATASLDNASQARIQQLFDTELKGRCTLIAVVHRLEMVQRYDRIVVMKSGKISEIGTYEELISQGGLFYELAHGV